ncbi:MAG: AAA family ATPase [Patescibacteria group bacterium]|jgi:ATP-dependent exoDNAse (exonuclease V) alpha subunit
MTKSKHETKTIELNEQFKTALNLLENSYKNLFITGRAGTGKSTLLEHFRLHTKKKLVVLAPTGVAALNVKGQTIHSFFGFRPDITPQKIKQLKSTDKKAKTCKKLEMIVIDEISMVRADLLDCIDKFMRLNGNHQNLPFGGVQMIFIGDLYQLPPVVSNGEKDIFASLYPTPYFFSANVFGLSPRAGQLATQGVLLQDIDAPADFSMEFVELDKIYRQSDTEFIGLLNAVRDNSITPEQLTQLNSRVNQDFTETKNQLYVYLTPTNALADGINQEKLAGVESTSFVSEGVVSGNFELRNLPTAQNLEVKVGSQVMMLNNDSSARWVNGSIGQIINIRTVTELDKDLDTEIETTIVDVKLSTGKTVEVAPFTWEMYSYFYDETKGFLDSEVVGSFTQYPMKLAWAVTIHKSQGKTFDRVILDIGNGTFAHGQAYVALSRCTSFEGLVLKKPLQKSHIIMDWRVNNFITTYQYGLTADTCPADAKTAAIQSAIDCAGTLEITYLKSNDVQSRRTISPNVIGEMNYMGQTFLGIEAYCHERQEKRCFRLDRILEIHNTD